MRKFKEKLKTNFIIKNIKKKTSEISDISFRKIKFKDDYIYIVYNESTASSDAISDFVIRSIENIDVEESVERLDAKEKWKEYKKNSGKNLLLNSILKNIEEKISINSVKVLDYKIHIFRFFFDYIC